MNHITASACVILPAASHVRCVTPLILESASIGCNYGPFAIAYGESTMGDGACGQAMVVRCWGDDAS
jgi:hypothetical protein